MKTIDIDCLSYAVKADLYEGDDHSPVVLSLIGRTSQRKKRQYVNFFPRLASELGITTLIFDYSGHGESPLNFDDVRPAQHSLEVVTVFDWIKKNFPNRKIFVIGSSYGGYMAARLSNFRTIDGLIFRAPAMYDSDDFYNFLADQVSASTQDFRNNRELVDAHPYLKNASKFEGDVLVITHENDEHTPRVVTDVFRERFNAEEVVVPNITHSLDSEPDEQIEEYNQIIFDWLKERI